MKTFLGMTLAVTLFSLPVAAQSHGGPLVTQPETLAAGQMQGFWNLPLNGALGVASGPMSFGGVPQFRMVADLPPEPLVFLQGGIVLGGFQGGLQQFPLTPGAPFVFDVAGQWRWDSTTGRGFYNGFITTIGLPNPSGVPILLVGAMRGSFQDLPPVTPLAPDPQGGFAGIWTLFFLSAPAPRPEPHPYPGPGQDET